MHMRIESPRQTDRIMEPMFSVFSHARLADFNARLNEFNVSVLESVVDYPFVFFYGNRASGVNDVATGF